MKNNKKKLYNKILKNGSTTFEVHYSFTGDLMRIRTPTIFFCFNFFLSLFIVCFQCSSVHTAFYCIINTSWYKEEEKNFDIKKGSFFLLRGTRYHVANSIVCYRDAL